MGSSPSAPTQKGISEGHVVALVSKSNLRRARCVREGDGRVRQYRCAAGIRNGTETAVGRAGRRCIWIPSAASTWPRLRPSGRRPKPTGGWRRSETDLSRGDLHPRGEPADPLREYAGAWLTGKPNLRPKTVEVYRYVLRVHILPTFGAMPLGRIDVAAVRTWHGRLAAQGLAKATTAKAYRVLRQILAAAVDDHLLRDNPCRVVGAASEQSAERRVPSLDEVVALADGIAPRYRAMVSLGVLWVTPG